MNSMANDFVAAGVNLQFSYAAGEAASRFLTALRDEKKIYGTRCPMCRRVLVPARSFCPRCFVETSEWLEVGPNGTLVAFANLTPVPPSLRGKGEKVDSPLLSGEGQGERLALALICLDGADTALVHRVGEINANALRIGLRVTVVFAETRTGSILDITYFKPVKE